MEVKQIAELLNEIQSESTGLQTIVQEDLSNVVDLGTEVFNANAVENYVGKLVDKVGKFIVSNRVYKGELLGVLMDSWEFGSVVEKVTFGLADAQENESRELEDGVSYDQDIFKAPDVSVKYFNGKVTFEVQLSITDVQMKSAFSTSEEMRKFVEGLYNYIETSLTSKTENLIKRTINNMIANAYINRTNYAGAINLLAEYKTATGDNALTKAQALYKPEFIRFASYKIKSTLGKLKSLNTLLNVGRTPKFTPSEDLHLILHSDFKALADVYLQSETFHEELTKLPVSESVAYWQGTGTSFGLADTTKINVKTQKGDVELDYIVGVAFDRDALGVSNFDRRVPTHRNAKGEFTNMFYKQDAHYFNDLNENFVVFYLG
jgi:hypothetical protein